MTGPTAFAVISVTRDPFLLARQVACGLGTLYPANAVEKIAEPAWYRGREIDHFSQAHWFGRWCRFALGNNEVPETLALAQYPGRMTVRFAFEQQQVAIGAQNGLDRSLPGGVDDFDDFGKPDMTDAFGAEGDTEAIHFGIARGAATQARAAKLLGLVLERCDQLALLATQGDQRRICFFMRFLECHCISAVLVG
ncbi:hypothetical protein SDC9_148726 [bioreactor metagenome]|uniref:Uncharacterized protein n=1 Tax=bioreactor metagenome TaxID=1076179 RepID=A0A645EID1_9ZZZZ